MPTLRIRDFFMSSVTTSTSAGNGGSDSATNRATSAFTPETPLRLAGVSGVGGGVINTVTGDLDVSWLDQIRGNAKTRTPCLNECRIRPKPFRLHHNECCACSHLPTPNEFAARTRRRCLARGPRPASEMAEWVDG